MPDSNVPDLSAFDRLERRRRDQHARQRVAFNDLGAATDAAGAQAAWTEYCGVVRQLEESIAELEMLIWNLRV